MTLAETVRRNGRAGNAVSRGVEAGALTGLVLGGLTGTLIVPILGTALGAIAGAVAGGLLGTASGAVLGLVAGRTERPAALRLTGGLSAGGGGLVLLLVCFRGHPESVLRAAPWFSGVCAVIGALAGVRVALGPVLRPPPSQASMSGPRRRAPFSLWQYAVGGAITGAGIGAAIGVFRDRDYLPTAPAALVEGAIFGVGPGAMLGVLVGCGVRAVVLLRR